MTTQSVSELFAERARIEAALTAAVERQESEANAVFGRNLKRLRNAAGLRQEDLADKIGLNRTSVANMEAGRQATPWPKLILLADALGVSLDEFRSVRP